MKRKYIIINQLNRLKEQEQEYCAKADSQKRNIGHVTNATENRIEYLTAQIRILEWVLNLRGENKI